MNSYWTSRYGIQHGPFDDIFGCEDGTKPKCQQRQW